MRLRSSSLLLAFLLLAAALFAVGCPKPAPPPQPTPDPTPAPARVAVDRVSPSSVDEGRGVTVTVLGRGFEDGAKVFLNSREMRGVDVIDQGELTFRASEDLPAGRYAVRVVLSDGEQGRLDDAFSVLEKDDRGDCALQTVYFEFNESGLTSEAREALGNNAECIQARRPTEVLVEGHADERGSTEYNLGLGQRRADSVVDYLVNLGVSSGTLRPVSYGEERPAVSGSSETAWAKNRRVELILR